MSEFRKTQYQAFYLLRFTYEISFWKLTNAMPQVMLMKINHIVVASVKMLTNKLNGSVIIL